MYAIAIHFHYFKTLLLSKGMGQADPLAARCSVKGCREQPLFIWLARCGCSLGFSTVAGDYHIFRKFSDICWITRFRTTYEKWERQECVVFVVFLQIIKRRVEIPVAFLIFRTRISKSQCRLIRICWKGGLLHGKKLLELIMIMSLLG